MAYQNINSNEVNSIRHISKFGGENWYVDANNGNDSNTGMYPDDAFLTIGKAISEAAAGDAITIRQGTYTETGINVNKNGLELHFEIGAILNPASGVPLTISANYTWVGCHDGALRINNDAGANTGVLITGNWAYLSEIRVACVSTGDIGFDIQGDGCDLRRCRCSAPLTAAFKIQGDECKLEDCCTGGETADTSIGFWITNSCDKTRVRNCSSQGHSTAGFQFDLGCTNGIVCGGSSGGGDGKFINNATTTNCIFSGLRYQGGIDNYNSPIVKVIEFQAGVTQYNLFKITGSSRIVDVGGEVITALPATSTVPNLELTSTNGSVDLTDAAGGPDISGAVVGATLLRNEDSSEPLAYANPDSTPAIIESANFRSPKIPVEVFEDDAADTYITLNLTNALASGSMIWALRKDPLSADGFVEPA